MLLDETYLTCFHLASLCRFEVVMNRVPRLREVLSHVRQDHLWTAEASDVFARRHVAVERSERTPQCLDVIERQLVSFEQNISAPCIGKPRHLHRVVDDFPATPERMMTTRVASDGDHRSVHVRSKSAV